MGEVPRATSAEERVYMASQWQLMWRRFRKHKLAIIGMCILAVFYIVGVFAEFFSTQDIYQRNTAHIYAPPHRLRFVDANGTFSFRPFVYAWRRTLDRETMERSFTLDTSEKYPVYFFVRGDSYKLWNLFETNIRLLGIEGERLFLFGTDRLGRDLFSRTLHAARISLSVGLIGVALSFVLGCLFGGISGYYGGLADTLIQRIIEFLISLPVLPLWMALAAALPADWDPLRIYFGITIILSLIGWTQLARVIRGKLISLKNEDYVLAAKLAGARERFIIVRHLLPAFLSYLIVSLTLAIPQMILGETVLSFLGLGLQPPVVSWGVLLQEAQAIRSIALHPWLLMPAAFIILAVLAFNFVGDGLRDAADPYK